MCYERLWQTYTMPVIVSKTMIEKTSFDSHPYPAGTNRLNAQVGLLTHLVCCAFPVFTSGKECNKLKLSEWKSRYTATGIVPDSHRIPFSLFNQQKWHLSSMCTANVCDIFDFAKQFCDCFFSLLGLYLRYKILKGFSNNRIFFPLNHFTKRNILKH